MHLLYQYLLVDDFTVGLLEEERCRISDLKAANVCSKSRSLNQWEL